MKSENQSLQRTEKKRATITSNIQLHPGDFRTRPSSSSLNIYQSSSQVKCKLVQGSLSKNTSIKKISKSCPHPVQPDLIESICSEADINISVHVDTRTCRLKNSCQRDQRYLCRSCLVSSLISLIHHRSIKTKNN